MSRRGSGTTRSTENTAAASVGRGDRAEQHRELPGQAEQVVRRPTATTATETTTPTVARESPSRIEGRASRQLVVRPPSARMTASAAKPSEWASSAFSKSMPTPASPSATPISR